MSKTETRERILLAAVDQFAERGFQRVTVSSICQQAKANVALVNYYFGSKQRLYREALRTAFEVAERQYPIRGSVPSRSIRSSEQQLKTFMNAVIRRAFDTGPAGKFDRMLAHETTRETEAEDFIVKEVFELQGKALRRVLQTLLGTRSRERIAQAHLNIAALCVFPKLVSPLRKMRFPTPPTDRQLSSYIRRQTDFALAGLATLKS
ncbi:TetR family transcriptional regulator [Pelagicoccus sp. SDUM812003]|uniref:TetR/AcrR family transcriptional regulator n=1 Tax=Pelagicoccus sp. SDUM812003 TaxID=3041267 RepID=UPI00280EE378|nr:TetR family transcriptional regulator [Pelagicoccus sp. SDUM812003]MDQ8201864.1 CerR family C-terminal domain-containing protein [Pelagicoccus sp. SDUM812003]